VDKNGAVLRRRTSILEFDATDIGVHKDHTSNRADRPWPREAGRSTTGAITMVEQIPDMPPATLGFRVSGRLAREDYVRVLVPPLRRAVEAGERLRVLYAIRPELHMEPGALWEDIKVELELGIRHRDVWERIAVVTDIDSLWQAFALFSWMVPGEMRLFHERDLEAAKAWLSA
jgi:hypothetical protein